MVALCDLIEEKAIATAKRHGLTDAKIYTDYKEMLADESIDIIHVCTPNVAHCQITVDAFEAGNMFFVKNQWQLHPQTHRK